MFNTVSCTGFILLGPPLWSPATPTSKNCGMLLDMYDRSGLSHAAGRDNKVRHLPEVHVHPFVIKPFVFNYHFSSQLIQKAWNILTWPGGVFVCVRVYRCERGGVGNSAEMHSSWKHVAPLTPKPCSLTKHMSVSCDCRQSKRDGTEQGL